MIMNPLELLFNVPDFSQEHSRHLHFTFSQLSLSFHEFAGLFEVVLCVSILEFNLYA